MNITTRQQKYCTSDSNSLGGIRIQPLEGEMPTIKPRTKAPKPEQLAGGLGGELATYEQVGLFQRSVTKRTAYRYRGCLLQYQKALDGATPTLEASMEFLAHLRQQGFAGRGFIPAIDEESTRLIKTTG